MLITVLLTCKVNMAGTDKRALWPTVTKRMVKTKELTRNLIFIFDGVKR
mgnify:CR=1 FL=1